MPSMITELILGEGLLNVLMSSLLFRGYHTKKHFTALKRIKICSLTKKNEKTTTALQKQTKKTNKQKRNKINCFNVL